MISFVKLITGLEILENYIPTNNSVIAFDDRICVYVHKDVSEVGMTTEDKQMLVDLGWTCAGAWWTITCEPRVVALTKVA